MTHSQGYRCKTRYCFARKFRRHGMANLTTYNRVYKLGQYVNIKVNGAYHKGMPHRYYNGRTGTIFNIGPRALGVQIQKRVRGRIMLKRINVRLEHIHPSDCRKNHLERVAANDAARRLAKETGQPVPCLKRQNALPRAAHVVSIASAIDITPLKYDGVF